MSTGEDPSRGNLIQAILSALWTSEPIRAMSLDQIQVDVNDGIVELRGVVASEAMKHAAERLTKKVPGVKAVLNGLITDEELERRIALALASHPELHRLRISVSVTEGVVSLFGVVSTPTEAEAVRELALGVPGVAGVDNSLHVLAPGTPVILAWQHSLEGRPQRPEEPREDSGGSQPAEGVAAAPVEG